MKNHIRSGKDPTNKHQRTLAFLALLALAFRSTLLVIPARTITHRFVKYHAIIGKKPISKGGTFFLLAPVFLVLLIPTRRMPKPRVRPVLSTDIRRRPRKRPAGRTSFAAVSHGHYVPYQFGASAATCPGTGNANLGMLQWTGSAFQGCTASGWGSLASGAGATALSSLISGTAVNTIDNTSMAQTWTWNSLTTQTAFTLSSSSLTNGNILSIQNTAVAVTSTGKVLSISDTTTGAGYGVYSAMSGKTNSGYAGYFTNTGSTNTGYAGYFINTDTSGNTNYGGYFKETSSGAGAAVYAITPSSTNIGNAAYFENDTAVDLANGYGSAIYATVNNTDQAIYAVNNGAGAASLPKRATEETLV